MVSWRKAWRCWIETLIAKEMLWCFLSVSVSPTTLSPGTEPANKKEAEFCRETSSLLEWGEWGETPLTPSCHNMRQKGFSALYSLQNIILQRELINGLSLVWNSSHAGANARINDSVRTGDRRQNIMTEIALPPSLFTVFLSFSFQIHFKDKHKILFFFFPGQIQWTCPERI